MVADTKRIPDGVVSDSKPVLNIGVCPADGFPSQRVNSEVDF
ncbi:hypothetical protein ASAP_0378 [Asaia bogorensis]|uniref:Uncharacterized protein n=1 Tax=Asaia bogorensis TaxID=91915 RepID=A0A060QCL2_9PROT|nr:hypothetical protein ASAP_0378 [Asaia bogorensis]